jgi:hypothetical protein
LLLAPQSPRDGRLGVEPFGGSSPAPRRAVLSGPSRLEFRMIVRSSMFWVAAAKPITV